MTSLSQPRVEPKANGAGAKPRVCMVAYSDYVFDARIRREAETLASNGFHVTCLKLRNGREREQYVLNNVEVRELSVSKYQGKSRAAYLQSYLRFLIESSAVCIQLLLKGELDVVHVHNLPDFLSWPGSFHGWPDGRSSSTCTIPSPRRSRRSFPTRRSCGRSCASRSG